MSARRSLAPLALSLAALLQAGSASALHEEPTINVGRVGGTTWDMLDSGTLTAPGGDGVATWSLDDPFVVGNYSVDSWTITLKEDPFVTSNFALTNTSGMTSTFVVTVMLPIPAFAYDTVINSSMGVSVTDSNGDGNLIFDTSGATPIYQGFVDFPVSTTLLGMNPILAAPGTFPVGSTADCSPFAFNGCTASGSNGVASMAVASGVTSLIGIAFTFQLSDGDSVGITSRFEIVNVPEPTSAALLALGLGLGGLLLMGRRTA